MWRSLSISEHWSSSSVRGGGIVAWRAQSVCAGDWGQGWDIHILISHQVYWERGCWSVTVQGLHVSARLGTCLLWYKFGEHLNGLTETGEHLLYSFSSGNCDVVDILSLYIFNSKYCPSVKYIPPPSPRVKRFRSRPNVCSTCLVTKLRLTNNIALYNPSSISSRAWLVESWHVTQ